MAAEKIISDWKNKIFKPIYWLEGDEPFFIDQVIHFAESNLLSPEEASFNLHIFYGKDADWTAVINTCKSYPMFGDKQVVILKEAQLLRDIDKLESYVDKPLTSTIFIVAYKDKKLDGRSKMAKAIKKHGYFNSEKIKDYQLEEWAQGMIKMHGLTINRDALKLLTVHIGNDLSRIVNEVEKLSLNLNKRKNITENDIENYVGISKEYNVFELQNALSVKDLAKAINIIQYFNANPKAAPIQMILPALYSYFSKIYSIYALPDNSLKTVSSLFNNSEGVAKYALETYRMYGYGGAEKVLLLLHQYNLRSIGVHDGNTEDGELLKELAVKIIHG